MGAVAMTDYSDLALADTGADVSIELGTLIALGYYTDDDLHLTADYYPIYDERHRDALNRRILEHYRMQEIGYETPQAFVFALGRRMAEIMPYYNQMYETQATRFDPLVTTDIWSDADMTGAQHTDSTHGEQTYSDSDSTNTSTSQTDNNAIATESTFPQTRLDDLKKYATHGSQSDSTSTVNSTGEQKATATAKQDARDTGDAHTTSNSKAHTKGVNGSQAALIAQWRNIIINIDMMIVAELDDLFQRVWGSGDPMTTWPVGATPRYPYATPFPYTTIGR